MHYVDLSMLTDFEISSIFTYRNIYRCKIDFVQLNSYENHLTLKFVMKIIHSNKKLITVSEQIE